MPTRDTEGAGPDRQALPPAGPVEALPDDVLRELREALRRAGYGDEIADEAESLAYGMIDAVRRPVIAWRLRKVGTPAALATLLFLHAGRLDRRAASALLGPDLLSALLGAGLLADADGGVVSRFRLTPLQGLLFLHDPFEGGPETAMGPGITTVALARLLPASPGAVLDVGCGAGTLALLAAARGARRAVGVDLSERAVALARVNARLNGVAAEFRAGDLLAPVRGERFDLLLSQPPYVVAPPGLAPTTYLHGGSRGDELAMRFASAFPEALAEGGRAALFFDLPKGAEPVHRRLRRALGGARVSLAVLTGAGPSSELSAMAYATLEDPSIGPRYAEAVLRYREHIESVAPAGFVRALAVLERPAAGAAGFETELQVGHFDGVDAAGLARWLAGLALVAGPEEALRAAAVRPAPGARLAVTRRLDADTPPTRALRFAEKALPRDFELSEAGEALIEALAVAGSVAEGEALFAEACGRSPEAVRATVMGFVRDGLGRAALAPA